MHKPLKMSASSQSFSPTRAIAQLCVLSDLDGTLLPRPYGLPPVTPPLSDGPAYAALVRLLDLGALVVGVTGSGFASHSRRFFRELPLEHRKAGRVLMAVETGSKLYRGSPVDGEPVLDETYAAHFNRKISPLSEACIGQLVEIGRAGLARFHHELKADTTHALIDPASDPLAFLCRLENSDYLDCAPLSTDVNKVPRIEVREDGGAVVFVGVPARLGAGYFSIPDDLSREVDGKPTGRMCFDCIPQGLSKALVLDYLIEGGEVVPGRAVALGDQPAGNDEGLTRMHPSSAAVDGASASASAASSIPFLSVSERESMVPAHLRPWHVTRHGGNAAASGAVLGVIADAEAAAQAAGAGGACLDLEATRELVRLANEPPAEEAQLAPCLPKRGSEESLAPA